jgi:hypothetical protein
MIKTQHSRSVGLRYLFGAVLALIVGLFLNSTKPVWFAPPLFTYTPLLYVIIMVVWLPLLYFALARLINRNKWLALLLLGLIACGQWFCWASIAPRQQIAELFGGASVFSQQRCAYTSSESGERYYTCELRMASSDDPNEWVLRQRFRVWQSLPLMWRVESNFQIE